MRKQLQRWTGHRERARKLATLTVTEIMEELRAVQTGVQILFAFLLSLAFTARFKDLDRFEVGTYVTTLLLTVITSAVIATPIALHRRMGHSGSNAKIIPVAAYIAEIGLALLALALNGVILLVTDFVLGRIAAICITVATTSIFAGLWFFLPRALRPSRRFRKAPRRRSRGGSTRDQL